MGAGKRKREGRVGEGEGRVEEGEGLIFVSTPKFSATCLPKSLLTILSVKVSAVPPKDHVYVIVAG